MTYYACNTFKWVFFGYKENLRIVGFFASLSFLTYLCDKNTLCSVIGKIMQIARAFKNSSKSRNLKILANLEI